MKIEDLETGQKRLDVRADVVEELARRGIVRAVQSTQSRPAIPEPITALDDNQLGDLLNKIQIYAGFVEEEVAKAKAELDGAKATESFIRARVRIDIRASKKLKPDESRDLMETDGRVVGAKSRTLYFHAIYDYAVAVQKSVGGDWDTVSRRITQRVNETDRFRRGTNVENQTRDVSPFAHFASRPGQ